MFLHKGRHLKVLVHGDDYATVGRLEIFAWLTVQLEAKFEMKTVIVGHSEAEWICKEGKILNRVVRATPEGWEYEPDLRHAAAILED